MNSASHKTPWYESNLVWGPLSLAVGIVLAVIAGMKHDLRWLLIFAWICFLLTGFFGGRQAKLRKLWLAAVTLVVAVATAGILLVVNRWLRTPEAEAQAHTTVATPSEDTLVARPSTPTQEHSSANAHSRSPAQSNKRLVQNVGKQTKAIAKIGEINAGNESVIVPGAHIEQKTAGPNSPNVVGSNNQFNYSAEPSDRLLRTSEQQQQFITEMTSNSTPEPFWIIIETDDYDKGSEQMEFGRELEWLLVQSHWHKLTTEEMIANKIGMSLYQRVSNRGVTIAAHDDRMAAARTLGKTLDKFLIRNRIRDLGEDKWDFVLIVVGIQ